MFAIYKWIKGFGAIFKEITEKYIPKDLNQSDEWHVDETVIKIAGKKILYLDFTRFRNPLCNRLVFNNFKRSYLSLSFIL